MSTNQKTLLYDLQEAYIANKSKENWDTFFLVILGFCRIAIKKLMKEKCLSFTDDYIEEKALDATMSFINQYRDNPDYRIRLCGAFASRLRLECFQQLFGYKTIKDEHKKAAEVEYSEVAEDSLSYEEDNNLSASEQYKIVELADSSKSFLDFIKAIADIHGKEYCYEKVKFLQYVYRDSGKGYRRNCMQAR